MDGAKELENKYGVRYTPRPLLVEFAQEQKKFC